MGQGNRSKVTRRIPVMTATVRTGLRKSRARAPGKHIDHVAGAQQANRSGVPHSDADRDATLSDSAEERRPEDPTGRDRLTAENRADESAPHQFAWLHSGTHWQGFRGKPSHRDIGFGKNLA